MENIKSREIKWHPKTKKISQVPKEGLEYALVSNKYEQVHQLVWCKDFIQDVIHGFLNKSVADIYGFIYDPSIDAPVSLKQTRLMVTNWKDSEFGQKIVDHVLPILHSVEDQLKMRHTIVEKCARVPPRYNRSGVWLFDSSKRWSKAPPMISLFTLLIRLGLVRQGNDSLDETIKKICDGHTHCYFSNNQNEDDREDNRDQVKDAEKGLKYILKHGDRRIFHADIGKNYPPIQNNDDKYVSIYSIHERSGIAAFSDGETRHLFPHWHRFEDKHKYLSAI